MEEKVTSSACLVAPQNSEQRNLAISRSFYTQLHLCRKNTTRGTSNQKILSYFHAHLNRPQNVLSKNYTDLKLHG